jgi:hypothetical protein
MTEISDLGINLTSYDQPLRQLLLVSPELLDEVWDAAKELLGESPQYWQDTFTYESLYFRIKATTAQLWLMNDETEFVAGMVTEILKGPISLDFKIIWIGGVDFDGAVRNGFTDYIHLWAKREGCTRVKFEGRKAWTRKLLPLGYKVTAYVMTHDLTDIKEC